MSSSTTPNMSLVIPGVGTESGPLYAVEVNNSLTILDGHNHTTGSGVQIPALGLNINADLTFNGNQLLNAKGVNLALQSSDLSGQTIYLKYGGEGAPGPYADLWYNDGSNSPIQITKQGTVNATVGSIPGESFGGGTFTWKQPPGNTIPANFDIGGIILRPNVSNTVFGVNLVPPGSIASQYTIALPQLPGSQSFLTLDNSGNMATPIPFTQGITASNIANNTITAAQISATANITGSQLANQTVTATQIANATITNTQIANTTITGAKLALATVDHAQIAANAVDYTNQNFVGTGGTYSAVVSALWFGYSGTLNYTSIYNGTHYYVNVFGILNGSSVSPGTATMNIPVAGAVFANSGRAIGYANDGSGNAGFIYANSGGVNINIVFAAFVGANPTIYINFNYYA